MINSIQVSRPARPAQPPEAIITEPVPFHEKSHTLTVAECGEQYRSIIAAVSEQNGKAIVFDADQPIVQITQYQEPPPHGYGSMKSQIKLCGPNAGTCENTLL